MSIHGSKLIPAFCGIVVTFLAGTFLDAVWPASSQPAIQIISDQTDHPFLHSDTELSYFLQASGNAMESTASWIKNLGPADKVGRIGAFELLWQHLRYTVDQTSNAVMHADLGGVVEGFQIGFRGIIWLLSMHTFYAVVFFLILVVIWAFFGGAISRAAALDFGREEILGLGEVFAFSKRQFLNFAVAPLLPVGFFFAGALFLWVSGWIGMIPAAGEVLVGLFFFLSLLAGFFVALVMIFGIAGFPLMMPAIATDNLDALDALSTTYSYLGARPWKTAFYALLATCYGAICLVFVKLFVLIMLWSVGHFTGASMNGGEAFGVDPAGKNIRIASKLNAMWQAPAFADDRPFFGTFGDAHLRHASWFGQLCLKAWIYGVWALVAAFVVSFFCSASSVVYFLLRRDVDLKDTEDVYLEADDNLAGDSESKIDEKMSQESAGVPAEETPPPDTSTAEDQEPPHDEDV